MSRHSNPEIPTFAGQHTHVSAVGMWIPPRVLERACENMIGIILYCLPHAIRGTAYTVGSIPQLRMIRVASGHRNGETDEILWDDDAVRL